MVPNDPGTLKQVQGDEHFAIWGDGCRCEVLPCDSEIPAKARTTVVAYDSEIPAKARTTVLIRETIPSSFYSSGLTRGPFVLEEFKKRWCLTIRGP